MGGGDVFCNGGGIKVKGSLTEWGGGPQNEGVRHHGAEGEFCGAELSSTGHRAHSIHQSYILWGTDWFYGAGGASYGAEWSTMEQSCILWDTDPSYAAELSSMGQRAHPRGQS